ncbi:MAG: hypothetical protein E7404_07610 [Ruminococcaceae bacterium]|nr:hypothetical protein [Oscillospiraceae bacterium]
MENKRYDRFYPGKEWLDTDGKRIQAHGGSIMYANGKYYLYGENKEKSLPSSGIWHWGVRLYSSDDLYNWKDEGIIFKASEDEKSPVHFAQHLDRPHIIYNEKTNKYVMWIKIMKKERKCDQIMVVAVADKITDEFKMISAKTILGVSSGDFDLVCDEKTKKAYIYFDKVHDYKTNHLDYSKQHDCVVCAPLNDDYTDVEGSYTEHLKTSGGADGREAPSFFERDGKKYLLTSATTGYFPNPTECAVCDSYQGDWENIGTIHVNDTENTSFRSQISSVFKHPFKKDLYIAVADRWLVNLPDNFPSNFCDILRTNDDPSKEPLMSKEELDKIMACNSPEVRNTSIADYVYLPIEFDGNIPKIKWYDEWKIEDFE